MHRITSYNVCYTKLLRTTFKKEVREQIESSDKMLFLALYRELMYHASIMQHVMDLPPGCTNPLITEVLLEHVGKRAGLEMENQNDDMDGP